MYFWIVWDNKDLIEHALTFLHAQNISFLKKHIITFETELPERLQQCASLIKRGKIYSWEELELMIESEIIGVSDKILGTKLKKKYSLIKRFKLIDLVHSDLEIKEKWSEIIEIEEDHFGIVQWYQSIQLYEAIDFWKPISGMWIGMMPSKLALTLINIAIGHYEIQSNLKDVIINFDNKKSLILSDQITIRDPFCWFGTTNFLANALGYDSIWSDINITQAKINKKRREQEIFYLNKKITLLKHDVFKEFKTPIFHYANIIVSEWWLWPTVNHRTGINEIEQYSKEVSKIYKSYFANLTKFFQSNKETSTLKQKKICVITIPIWLKYDLSISQQIATYCMSLGRSTTIIEKPYKREKQLVGREVLIWVYEQ